ncbi:MAG: phage tail assembly protein [Ruminococcus sp.]
MDTKAINTTDNENNAKRVIVLNTPIDFEGATYKEIDLSGLDELTGKDIKFISKQYRRLGGSAMTKELDIEYLQLVAAKATGLPVEFFDELKAKDSTTVEVIVRNFLIL